MPTPSIPANRYVVFALLAAGGCALDLWTKHVMFTWPQLAEPGSVYWLVPEYAGFQTSLNEGALFGMGQGAQMWFALVSAIAAMAIPYWLFRYGHARDWGITLILGAILGGILGNLYDRLGLYGMQWGNDWPLRGTHANGDTIYAVRDWILWQAGDRYRWPNFNIADSLLVVSAGLLVIRAWREPAATDEPTEVSSTKEKTSANS